MKAEILHLGQARPPSAMADVELQHIERALAQLRTMSQSLSSGTLNVEYWRERLTAVSADATLVPAQKLPDRGAAHGASTRVAKRPRDATSPRRRTTNQALGRKAA